MDLSGLASWRSRRQQYRAEGRTAAGLGIGLAIVRQLVELHGGTAEATSTGTGKVSASLCGCLSSTRHSGEAASSEGCTPAPAPGSAMLTGLQCSWSTTMSTRETLREVLAGAGGHGTLASSGDALRVLGNLRPVVLISDGGMPGMDGFELLRRIRESADPRRSDLPALALSAFTLEQGSRHHKGELWR